MSGDEYLWDGTGEPDPETQRLEGLLGRFRYQPQEMKPASRSRAVRFYAPLALAASLVLAFGIWQLARRSVTPSLWEVSVLGGVPTVNDMRVAEGAHLTAGDWLETDDWARAQILMGEMGEVDVEPNSRIGVIACGPDCCRLRLARGTVHAAVSASPRQFVIETPTAQAVEAGGDYVLTVYDTGGGALCVIDGSVSFESDGRRSIVPAGAMCETRPNVGPGTPRCENAPDAFQDALEQFDRGDTGEAALSAVLAEAGPCDLIPLWHILHRADASERGRIYDRMTSFAPPPAEVTRDGILQLDGAMMQFWWLDIKSHRTCLLCANERQQTSS